MNLPQVPTEKHLGLWIAWAVGTLCLVPIGEEVSRRVGRWMRWREEPDESDWGWSWGSMLLGLVLVGCTLALLPARAAITAGIGMAVAWYIATLDLKERWVPDHGILILMFVGLEASPFGTAPERIDGALLCGAIALALLCVRSARSRVGLGWEAMSGGDVWFPVAMGAWITPQQALLAMAAYVAAECIATATLTYARPEPGAKPSWLSRTIGYDAETDTVPAVVYMAFAFCVALCTSMPTR